MLPHLTLRPIYKKLSRDFCDCRKVIYKLKTMNNTMLQPNEQ